MSDIIVVPSDLEEEKQGSDLANKFGYFETKNSPHRKNQEDGLAWHLLKPDALTRLDPVEIGHRLWTSYQIVNELIQPQTSSGTTASTTVFDGNDHVITATVGDVAAFIVAYDLNGDAVTAVRLNSVTHTLSDSAEATRIQASGGNIKDGRISGLLCLSRALGDSLFKTSGICPDAAIDIIKLSKIIEEQTIPLESIGSIQLITCCDGFTDAAENKKHEDYLLDCLRTMKTPARILEADLAMQLVNLAKEISSDNISVAIHTLTKGCPIVLGVYDGHGGKLAANLAASTMGKVFIEQCTLTKEQYCQQKSSVNNLFEAYSRDNNDEQLAERVSAVNKLARVSVLGSSIHALFTSNSSPLLVKTDDHAAPKRTLSLSQLRH